jgi:hypothetical protein
MSARPASCREPSCGESIFFIVSARDPKKLVPVDADSLNDEDLEALDRGEALTFDRARGHISHFTTCPAAARFSGRR